MKVYDDGALKIADARTASGQERRGLVFGVRLLPGQTLNDHSGRLIDTDSTRATVEAEDVAEIRDQLTDWLKRVGHER